MPPKKSAPAPAQRNLPSASPEQEPHPPRATATEAPAATSGRKKWIPRTPIEVMLGEIGKQEKRVAEMREELAKEERELSKLQQAKRVLESH